MKDGYLTKREAEGWLEYLASQPFSASLTMLAVVADLT